MHVDIWVDPACPFSWVTARWLFEEVAPSRDIDLHLRSISLLHKNDPEEGSRPYVRVKFSNGLLRVLESVRASEGDAAVASLYWEFAARIHHDKDTGFDPAEALAAVGLDPGHAAAATDDKWEEPLRESLAAGLAVAGEDVGVPIIAIDNSKGDKVGFFGPVLTAVPDSEQSLKLWDALVTMMDQDSFFELKRTRTQRPDPGERPQPLPARSE